MKIRDVMSPEVTVASPNDSLQEAARVMARIDAGSLPVGENDRLVGMITDRDIAIRGVGAGLDPASTRVGQIMSQDVKYCFDDEEIDVAADNMGDLQVRRLPVVNRDKRLVGIVSLGDIARAHKPKETGEALREVSQPGGRHNQSETDQRPTA